MKITAQNKIFFSIDGILRTVSLLCASGPLIQTLLSVLGYSTKYIYIYSTLLQAANVITIVLFSRFADKGNLFRRSALVLLVNGASFLLFLPLCLSKNSSLTVFILFVGISFVQQITTGLHTVCAYKIPYYVFKPEEYGRFNSIVGIISSVVSLIMSSLVSLASKKYDYEKIMIVAFIVSAVFVLISAVSTLKLKNITDKPTFTEKENQISLFAIIKEPVFLRLIPAGLFRGIAAGTVTVLAAVALDLGYDESISSAVASVQSAATLIGCALFGWLSYKIFPSKFVWWGSLAFISLPLVFINNPWLFLGVCVILNFGRALVDYGVPSMLIFLVPAEIAGPYNAWRMVLNNGGILIGTAIAAVLPLPVLIVLTMVLQLLSGLMYLYAKKICKIN